MNAKTVGIDIGQTLQELHTLQLVFHLFYTQLTESSLLECQSTVLAATVVKTKHHIALLSHPDVPTTHAPMTCSIDVVCMWASIDIYHSRVFLIRVEVGWQYQTIVQVGLSVGCLDSTHLHLRYLIGIPRLCSIEQ